MELLIYYVGSACVLNVMVCFLLNKKKKSELEANEVNRKLLREQYEPVMAEIKTLSEKISSEQEKTKTYQEQGAIKVENIQLKSVEKLVFVKNQETMPNLQRKLSDVQRIAAPIIAELARRAEEERRRRAEEDRLRREREEAAAAERRRRNSYSSSSSSSSRSSGSSWKGGGGRSGGGGASGGW